MRIVTATRRYANCTELERCFCVNAINLLEGAVAKINLSRMDVQELIDLRKQIEDTLLSQRSAIERQLEALGGSIASLGGKVARDGRSALKGKKVAPKYRGPDGETWAGRGAKPRWLVAAIKEGKKLEQFLIEKATPKARKKRRSKR
jgi:DNA-binding protein H-NS